MKRLLNPYSLNTDLATLVLRLIFGGMFIYHGYPKLTGYNEMLAMFGDPVGLGSELSLILVIFAEFFCGVLIVLGLFTRFAVVFTFITMLVAYFVAHANDDFMVKMLPFVYIWLCIVLFILGSGRYSLDAAFFNKTRSND
jgi:putative oxidoreductase